MFNSSKRILCNSIYSSFLSKPTSFISKSINTRLFIGINSSNSSSLVRSNRNHYFTSTNSQIKLSSEQSKTTTTTTTTTVTLEQLYKKMDPFIPHANKFINFIDNSPSPYHAVAVLADVLKQKGYVQLSEKTKWDLKPNGKYFFIRNQSCLSAFCVGGRFVAGNGFAITAAHTDSPNLKVRPISKVESVGYLQVGCETYGGGLWYTWFDRDLTLAGRVIVKVGENNYESKLVHIKRALLRIPSLAIHLDRSVNTDGFKMNTQRHLVPIIASQLNSKLVGLDENVDNTKHHPLLLDILSKELHCAVGDIVNFDLSVCDTQPGTIGGALSEYIHSPRLDNLCMSYCSIEALLNISDEHLKNEESVLSAVLFDNEEVGSTSPQGACAPLIVDTVDRINQCFASPSDNLTVLSDISMRKSFLISADMAHAVHPNYADMHEPLHRPQMNKGPVIKYNANLRYATDSTSAFYILELAKRNGVPVQEFLVKNDSACGSTIGPIISGSYGIKTVDIGNPQLIPPCSKDSMNNTLNWKNQFTSTTCKILSSSSSSSLFYSIHPIKSIDQPTLSFNCSFKSKQS
ncbi:aspartyl aminopeptidase [Heterostelium album PN500]|uniref:aspartyl aminopeptidase n=1 Tax=Heterostelium pallidum (strain ATCC 26659 / Pp 5 / PN500) TaxID=670386 RepID=D3BEF1_HETP5|nr:aspartyl aminopeptidase [Heterostelium album PN500]EFA80282.1 aspartyl aminopeptidase [Heterostelium album PN500]|eukprot:XP_020432402.1 aspartyl aminopeptidase [Heterostelium album PN500]